MMAQDRRAIGIREIRSLQPTSVIWDAKVAGFGARRQRSEAVAYVLLYRTLEGRQRWFTIGRHGSPWTPETARREAQRLLAEVAQGQDPGDTKMATRAAQTVGELCDEYLAAADGGRLLTRRGASKKPSTILTDRSRIERHIRPFFGSQKVASVTRADVERFLHAIADGTTARFTHIRAPRTGSYQPLAKGGRGAATRTVGLLGAIFSFAVRNGARSDNPVLGVTRFADGRRERRLTDAEYALFGATLCAAESACWPAALACMRFLALTGWRRGEAVSLRWADVDLARRTATLPDTKSGRSLRPLCRIATDLIALQPRGGKWIFPAARGDGPMMGFRKIWDRVMRAGGLPGDITPHVLRHSFASLGADLGLSELAIGALIGHRAASMTSRYTHHADAVLLAAADVVGDKTAELMDERAASLGALSAG